MTIVTALKKGDEIWMAADRETTYGYSFARSDQANGSKIVPFKNALIATSGLALYKNALRYYSQDPDIYKTSFENEEEVMNFFFQFHGFMKEKYGLGGAKNDEVEKLSYNSFLLVTESLIYQVSCARDVAVFENYTAIGNGDELALGAMHSLIPLLEDPAEILKRSVETACQFKHGCGGQVDIVNVTRTVQSLKKGSNGAGKSKGKTKAQPAFHLIATR